jgi:hypothetical protein
LVAITQPAAPTAVTATIVVQNVCGERKVRYAVPLAPVSASTAAATGYDWTFVGSTLHSGLNTTYAIDSMDANGLSASRVIVVRYISNLAAGTDSAKCAYKSNCGIGAIAKVKVPFTAAITQPAAPTAVTATVVTGTASSCSSRKVRYAVPAYPTAATGTTPAGTGYSWVFVGATLHGGLGTTYTIDSMDAAGLGASRVIVIKYLNNSAAAASDSVRCAYTSACGTGAIAKAKVPLATALTGCPIIATNIPVSKASVTTPAESMSVKVFPNPTSSNFNLQVVTAGKEEVTARVLDIQGRFIQSVKVAPNQTLSLGSALKAGAYFIEVRQGKDVKTTRVMKF